ncbi:MAG: cupin domain-containing protein [Paludibacter sp.]|nr:cupin domain-containing protein [Paludibacter sp.]
MTVENIKLKLDLQPHPEGGWYKETYRSAETLLTPEGNERNVSTAIYFLLENEDISHFHRIKSDEIWHFHAGAAIDIFIIENNELKIMKLGNDLLAGEKPQIIVPANSWFAAQLHDAKGYGLVSCTVAPGFDFNDFELATKEIFEKQGIITDRNMTHFIL